MRESFETAKRELQRAITAGEAVGGAHLVMQNGKVAHLATAGMRDLDEKKPFTPETLVRMYSMTKAITSVGAMQLWEKGKFQLDDPVSKYIPAFAKSMVMDGKGGSVPPKRPISVRDLFRHTSGYSYGDGAPEIGQAYDKEGLLYRPPVGMLPPKMTIEKAAEALARVPALHHPGERFTYGFGVDILGRLIEIWSGKPLDVYLREAIFQPLAMDDTGFVVPKEKRERFATCYTGQDGKLTVVDKYSTSPYNDGFEFLGGGSGLVSTILDYAKFCQLLIDGGTAKEQWFLKPETITLMFTDQLNTAGVDSHFSQEADSGFQFGLGFAIAEVTLGKRKMLQYLWGGYASTEFRLVPEAKLFQIFVQQRVPNSHTLTDKLFEMVYEKLADEF